VCVDSRADWLARLPDSAKLAKRQTTEPQVEVSELSDEDFVVLMTMGHRTDRPILETILRQDRRPAYLGVIGSEAKRKVLVRELEEGGIASDVAEQFRCPIGLRFGQNQPGEIAISIAAELIQVRDARLAGETTA
jgi:xanthine dehydrogenase accessory factor